MSIKYSRPLLVLQGGAGTLKQLLLTSCGLTGRIGKRPYLPLGRGQFSLPVNQWFGKGCFTGKRLFTGKFTEVFTLMHDLFVDMKKVRSD